MALLHTRASPEACGGADPDSRSAPPQSYYQTRHLAHRAPATVSPSWNALDGAGQHIALVAEPAGGQLDARGRDVRVDVPLVLRIEQPPRHVLEILRIRRRREVGSTRPPVIVDRLDVLVHGCVLLDHDRVE